MKFDDEVEIELVSALGCSYGKMNMPKKMRDGLIKVYFESGAVRSTYLFVDGKEITDGKNYNPYRVDKK